VKDHITSDNTQTWKLVADGSHYKIVVQDGTERILGVQGGGNSSGNIIELQTYSGQDYQLWSKELVTDSNPGVKYGFKRKNGSTIIRSEPAFGAGDPTPTVPDLQLTSSGDLNNAGWNKFYLDAKTCPTCTPPAAPLVTATNYSIVSGNSSQLTGSCSNGASLSWSHGLTGSPTVTPTSTTTYTATCTLNGCSNSSNVTITVTNPPSGNCYELRLAGGTQKRVTNFSGIVKVKPLIGSGNTQTWKLEPNGSYFKIIAQDGTNRVLGVESGGNSVGNIITLQTFSGQDHQLWTKQLVTDDDVTHEKFGFIRKGSSLIIHSEPGWGEGDDNPAVTDLKLTSGSDLNVFGRNKFFLDGKTCPSNLRIGLEEQNLNREPNALMVSPNPNNGEFDVSFQLEIGKSATLTVSDLQGKTWHKQVVKGKGSHNEKIKLTNFVPGMFLVQLRKGKDLEVKKIIVIR
jgi:hypothetical protein